MTGRPRSVSDDAIFDAVAAVVTESGPNGLTLAAVAARVGVSAPALTQRFGSKGALLLAFSQREVDVVPQVFARARASQPDPTTAVVSALVALQGHISGRDDLANNLAMLQMDLTDPELRANAVAHSRTVRDQLTALLQEAIDDGLLLSDVVAGALAVDVYTTYSGAMLTWAIDGDGTIADWLRESVERTLAPHRQRSRG